MRDDFGDAVGDTLRSILLFLPKALAFVAILVVGWLLAKAALKLVDRLLERVGLTVRSNAAVSAGPWPDPATTPATSSPDWPTTGSCCSPSTWPSGSGGRTRSPI